MKVRNDVSTVVRKQISFLLWAFYPGFLYNILKNRFLSLVVHK